MRAARCQTALELRVHREGLRHQESLSGEQGGVLDPDIMQPLMAERPDDQPSIMVEMAVAAAEQALIAAGREPGRSIW